MQNFESRKWLDAHKNIDNIRAVIFDLNGVMRGKRLPLAQLDKAIEGGVRIPLSAANVDIWGRDIEIAVGFLKVVTQMAAPVGRGEGLCQWAGQTAMLRWYR